MREVIRKNNFYLNLKKGRNFNRNGPTVNDASSSNMIYPQHGNFQTHNVNEKFDKNNTNSCLNFFSHLPCLPYR